MQMKKSFKGILASVMAVSLLLPSAVFAQSTDQDELDRIYGPENGSAVYVDHPQVINENTFGVESKSITARSAFLWSASYQVTSHYQIPYSIRLDSSNNTLFYSSHSVANTGTNSTYKVIIESFNGWAGGYISEQTFTHNVGGVSANSVYGLSTSKDYYIHIADNVKGNIDVSKS
ncbi:hypothetical protein [Paenibacillus sp. FSL L8-0506]|uniref:hypothetical protein n=1 Tax=Paenibacillus sp. FSL L8-0506 TaxID=2975335 RepID=UPI0030F75040